MRSDDVLQLYRARLAALDRQAARHERQHIRLGNARLAVAAAAGLVLVLAFGSRLLSPAWVVVPALVFAALAVWHDRVLQSWRGVQRSSAFFGRGVDRLTDAWAGRGEDGARFSDGTHLYEADLDLFGRGSLFQLITTARVRAGEEVLARWLLAPAGRAEIVARQEAIRELAPRIDLREALARLGEDVGSGVHPDRLVRWGTGPGAHVSVWEPWAAAVAAALTVTTLAIWIITNAGGTLFALAMGAEIGLVAWTRSRVRTILAEAEHPARDLSLLAGVLALFERETFESAKLQALHRALAATGQPASKRVVQLHWLMDLVESRRNQFFAPIAALLLWGTQLAFALERWRRRSGPHLPTWLEVIGEFEALCSLASYAYEHPEDPFPAIVDEGPLFEAVALGHPLIPLDRVVRNDVRLGPAMRLLVVSGSNMSGKSTLLRAVGVNAALGLAGAPVRAHTLRLSPLALGASLRIVDSLQAGRSRFYAEITRLRAIVGLTAGPRPVLFLLDELLSGTNSHDRLIGAEAIVRTLVSRGAIGLLTTHDLALSSVADRFAPAAINVHFADELEEGGLTFDYRMRPGVVKTSNALALMRSVGLEVD